VKRSGRNESIRVVMHLCMKAMLGISLYNYPYLNKQNHFVFLIIANIFSKKWDESAKQVLPGSQGGGRKRHKDRGRNDPNNVCTYEYVNKLKNEPVLR
jgi:hypothetical protein